MQAVGHHIDAEIDIQRQQRVERVAAGRRITIGDMDSTAAAGILGIIACGAPALRERPIGAPAASATTEGGNLRCLLFWKFRGAMSG